MASQEPKSRVELLEDRVGALEDEVKGFKDVLGELVNSVEAVAKSQEALSKVAVKKSTQRFGQKHERTAVKDTKTGKIYPSKFASGKALASEYDGLDPLNPQVYYQIMKKDPTRLVEATTEESAKAWKENDDKIAAEVAAANKAADEAAAKAAEEAKAAETAGKTGKTGKK